MTKRTTAQHKARSAANISTPAGLTPEQYARLQAEYERITREDEAKERAEKAEAEGKRYLVTSAEEEGGGGFSPASSTTYGQNVTAQGLVGLDFLRQIVNDESADMVLRTAAAQKLASVERYAAEKIDDRQLYRQPRSAIQAQIEQVRRMISEQGLDR